LLLQGYQSTCFSRLYLLDELRHNLLLISEIQIGMHGQAKDLPGDFITIWQLREVISHGWLMVEWHGVMHGGGNARLFHLFLNFVTVLHSDRKLREHACVVGFDVGQDHRVHGLP